MLAFAVFAALITIIPGLDTMLVVRTAAVGGRRAGIASGLGIGLGCLCWAAAGGLGITALLTASRIGYDVLRWAGAGYLCYLGARAIVRRREAAGPIKAGGTAPARGAWSAFRVGLATELLNPKVGVFYISVLPQFLPHGAAPLLASVALGAVHMVEGLAWFTVLSFVVGRASGLLGRPRVRRALDQISGVVFIGFGVRLAIEGASRA